MPSFAFPSNYSILKTKSGLELQPWAQYLEQNRESRKTREEKKSLISTFACFLTTMAKV